MTEDQASAKAEWNVAEWHGKVIATAKRSENSRTSM